MLKWGEQNSCVKGGIVMTRRIMCLIVAMALAALIMGGALAEPLKKVMMVDFCEEWVSLRDAPSTAGKRLAQVPLYALVTDAETSPAWGDFTYCRYDGQYGYILSKYLVEYVDVDPAIETWSDGDLGFSFLYDPGVMTVDAGAPEDGGSVTIRPRDADVQASLEIMTPERVGVLPWKFLELNAPEGVAYSEDTTQYGDAMHFFKKNSAGGGNMVEGYYAVDGPDNFAVAVGKWPEALSEDWGRRFTGLLRSLQFIRPELVRADWAEATPNAVVIDADGEYVTIMMDDQTVTGVQLLSLSLSDVAQDSSISFDSEVIYERDSIGPDAPLVVKIAFPGDIPSYGLRFTDAGGTLRQYAIAMSGYDGSVFMEEF